VTAVTVRVPAKVNLQLSVGPVRADGYHEIATVFHAVSLYDEVEVAPAERAVVTVTGEGAQSVPAGDSNLAVRAAAVLAEEAGVAGTASAAGTAPPVGITIRKRIPVAAGLAGGSADAAAALVGCNELWRTGLSQAELAVLAARIGSDVAFALAGGTAVGLGRGEQLTPALVTGQYHWVLAFAAGQLSTPDVYRACDRIRAAREVAVTPPRPGAGLLAALRSGDPAEVGPLLSNDLQPAAVSLHPDLRRTLSIGRSGGALGSIVSGSGPTCAFLAAGAEEAVDLAVALSGAGVCRSVARVTGPAQGAVVINPERGAGTPHAPARP
jgi:4-diphosphocytidyl-2-C-methyl-D-erythritol kinase